MPLSGGFASTFGNRYGQWWTVSQFVRILSGEAESIRIEKAAVEKAEFGLLAGDHQELHQPKRSHRGGNPRFFSDPVAQHRGQVQRRRSSNPMTSHREILRWKGEPNDGQETLDKNTQSS